MCPLVTLIRLTKPGLLLGVATILALVANTGWAQSGRKMTPEQIARLIRQLGHDEFAKREEAGEALVEIGEQALSALRQAAATNADPEVRWRAEQVIQVVALRLRAVAAEKELARWQGEWTADDGQWIAIHEDQWLSGGPAFGPVEGTVQVVEIREKMTLVDVLIHGGPTKGTICKLLLRREADLLHYCGTYEPAHPTEFKTDKNSLNLTLKRAPKGSIPHARKETFPMPLP